jgi:glycosyltransferase involved in cell wall biosynthesis
MTLLKEEVGAQRPKVLHVIDGLDVGGAEIMLQRLIAADTSGWEHVVVSLTTVGPVGERIQAGGTAVQALDMRPKPTVVWQVATLARLLRAHRPTVIQSWLYEADLLTALVRPLGRRRPPLLWGIHQSDLDPVRVKRRTRWTVRICARLSRVPTAIVCCSAVSAEIHAELGYDAGRMVVIPNGFDLDEFTPDAGARASVRHELGVSSESPLVGVVARWDPQKDHRNFLSAAAAVRQHRPDAVFVLCGKGIDEHNPTLQAWIQELDLQQSVRLLGRRDDIPRLMAALDVGVSSSAYGEAFPLAVGEAMASGVPCVVTDVGDCARLVGDTGRVVPPSQPGLLAAAVVDLLGSSQERGVAARKRVEIEFSLDRAVRSYLDAWTSAMRSSTGPGSVSAR